MQPLPPVLTADLFPGERAALLALLESLTPEQWAAPTVNPGWSVDDVALHILGGDLGILSRRRDGHADTRATEGLDLSDAGVLIAFINHNNDLWVRAGRRLSPRIVRELLAATGPEIAAHFAGLDPHATGVVVSWAGPGPAPVWLDTAREYTERWVHQQHIRDAVGQPGLRERRWFAPVLDAFARALPHALRDMSAPESATARLTMTGDAGGEWFAVRENARWVLRATATTSPVAAVTLPDDIAWRLFTKGMRPEDAIPHAQCEGNIALDNTILRMVSMIV